MLEDIAARDVVDPHQPVRLQGRPRRRPVRGRADREGRGRRSRPARRRPAGVEPRGQVARVLPPHARRRRRGLRHARHARTRAVRAARCGRRDALEPRRTRTHRPPQGAGRRRPRRLGRRRRDRGSLPGRTLPRPVPSRGGPGRRAAAARLRRELPLARRRDPGSASSTRSFPTLDAGDRARAGTRPAQRAREGTGRSPTRSHACSRTRGRRSTS